MRLLTIYDLSNLIGLACILAGALGARYFTLEWGKEVLYRLTHSTRWL